MAEPIQSPIGGGIRAVRRNVSSSIFTGGGVVRQQKQDSIVNNATFRNSLLLGNISKQVDSVSQQTGVLNKALQVISANLATSSALDKKRAEAQAKRERQLIQGGYRDSKEGAIESGIRNALVEPIKNIGKKVQFGLSKLINVFLILTGGWLINKTVDLLRALSGDNQEKFVKIRNDLIKGLLIIGGTVALFTAAFGGLGLGLGKLGLALGAVAFGGLLGNPLKKLKNAIFNTAKNAKNLPVAGASVPPAGQTKNPTKGGKVTGGKTGLATPSKFSLFITTMFGAKNVLDGKPFMYEVIDQGAGYGAASVGPMIGSKVPGPPWFKALAGVITSMIFFGGGYGTRQKVQDMVGEDKLNELQKDLESGNIMPRMMTPITDEDLLYDLVDQRPRREDFGASRSGAKRYKESLAEFEAANGERILELHNKISESKGEPIRNRRGRITGYKKDDVKIDPSNAKIEKTKSLSKELGSLKEPSPNIIPLPTGSEGGDSNAASGNVAAGAVGGGVPMIPASNKDNSYVFLAFKNYQVVPT